MQLRWIHDVFGNSVAIATFDERAQTLSFTSMATIEHNPAEEFALTADDPAYFYPFHLQRRGVSGSAAVHHAAIWSMPWRIVVLGAQLEADDDTDYNILSGMTHGIREAFTYRKRHEHGTQHPPRAATGSGTCRDYRLVHDRGAAALGIAARFVSGYLFIPGDSAHGCRRRLDPCLGAGLSAGSPAGSFDPTNGIIGTRRSNSCGHERDPRQAIPLHGASARRMLSCAWNCLVSVVSVGDERQDERQAGEGLIMDIKVGFEISYAAVRPTPMVIMLSRSIRRASDIVGTERIVAEPDVPIGFYRDSFGNVCGRFGRRPAASPCAAMRWYAIPVCLILSCRPRSRLPTNCRTRCCNI